MKIYKGGQRGNQIKQLIVARGWRCPNDREVLEKGDTATTKENTKDKEDQQKSQERHSTSGELAFLATRWRGQATLIHR